MGRSGILYKKDGRSLRIDSDFYSSPVGVIIFDRSLWLWDNPKQVPLSDEEKRNVLDEVVEFFVKDGYEVQIRIVD